MWPSTINYPTIRSSEYPFDIPLTLLYRSYQHFNCCSSRTQEEGEEGDQEGHPEVDHRRTADQAEDQDAADGCPDLLAVQVPVGCYRLRRQQHRQDLAGYQE